MDMAPHSLTIKITYFTLRTQIEQFISMMLKMKNLLLILILLAHSMRRTTILWEPC